MCGLIFTELGPERARHMLDVLRHRGPDRSSWIRRGKYIIGQNRLSIVGIDKDNANQPMNWKIDDCSRDTVFAFNGEIFNYKELALHANESEVEVLSRMVNNGYDVANYVNGYYASISLDCGSNKLILNRDLFGVMPLYYTLNPLEVASERKALIGKIYTVPANSRIEIDLASKKRKIYYNNWPFRFVPATMEQLTTAFLTAVKRTATHSDCGFSVALSGGLDSSLVLLACSILNLEPVNIITTYVQDTDRSEVERAQHLTQSLGWSDRHTIVKCEPMLDLRYWIETPKNPIRDFAFLRHATVAKYAQTKVILCGEGADELGLGYPLSSDRHIVNKLRMNLKRISLLKSQATMTLDRVNLAGMRYSKEYRVPFLDLDFVQTALGCTDNYKKSMFRQMGLDLGLPQEICYCDKYSNEELVGRS